MTPLAFYWSGRSMVPLNPRTADRQYTTGEVYSLGRQEQRSQKSHDHFFAAVEEAWRNLPDAIAGNFATADHLRRAALIHTGFRDERTFVASSRAEAIRLAAFLKPMDDYAIVSVSGSTVVVLTAKSQSMKAMGREQFQKSKDAVLDFLANLIGTTPRELQKADAA